MGIKYKEKVPQSGSSEFFFPLVTLGRACRALRVSSHTDVWRHNNIRQPLRGPATAAPPVHAGFQMLTNVLLDKELLENATHSDAARIISQVQKVKTLRTQLNTSAFHYNGNRTHEKKDKLLLPVEGFKENDVIKRCLSRMSHCPENRPFWWSD